MPGAASEFGFSPETIQRYKRVQALLEQLDPEAGPKALIVPGSPEPQGHIIVFPGSFNPPTNAHLALLEQAWHFANAHGPMRIYAAMSTHTTDKESVTRPLLLDRIILLEIVLRHHLPHTGIMLVNRGLYVEQAEGIHRCFPQVMQLYFLIGYDKIVQILDPRYYEDRDAALKELFALAEFLVAPRGNAGAEDLKDLLSKPENKQFARHIHALPLNSAYREISSTRIRQNPEAHAEDVPPEVMQFIRETHAYDAPQQLPDGSKIDYYGERMRAIEALLKDASAGM